MMVEVNGERTEIDPKTTLESLVVDLGLASRRVAVELNHEVVERTRWPDLMLADDDRLEIVQFVGGG
jgi:thiamine biosynthesis protein ThiS